MTQEQFRDLVYCVIYTSPSVYGFNTPHFTNSDPRVLRGERGIAVYFQEIQDIRIVTIDGKDTEIKLKDWSKYKSMIGDAPERGMDMADAVFEADPEAWYRAHSAAPSYTSIGEMLSDQILYG